MAQDGMTIRLHLKRMKVVRVVEDEIDKLVIEVADTRRVGTGSMRRAPRLRPGARSLSTRAEILEFADFDSAAGKRVLEIGVGMGADFTRWVRAGALCTGTAI